MQNTSFRTQALALVIGLLFSAGALAETHATGASAAVEKSKAAAAKTVKAAAKTKAAKATQAAKDSATTVGSETAPVSGSEGTVPSAASEATAPAAESSVPPPTAAPANELRNIQLTETPKRVLPQSEDYYGPHSGLLWPFNVGPFVSLLGLLQPLQTGLQVRFKDYVSGQFTYGFLPELSIKSVKVKTNAIDGRLRLHPFRGAFYLGAAMGSQTITANTTRTISGVSVTVNGEIKNKFITPQMGWRWIWESGFFMGLDLGWQINKNAKTTVTTAQALPAIVTSNADYTKAVTDITNAGNDLGNTAIPNLTLIQFGFYF